MSPYSIFFKLRNSKLFSVSSLTINHTIFKRLAKALIRLHVCWKSFAMAHMLIVSTMVACVMLIRSMILHWGPNVKVALTLNLSTTVATTTNTKSSIMILYGDVNSDTQ